MILNTDRYLFFSSLKDFYRGKKNQLNNVSNVCLWKRQKNSVSCLFKCIAGHQARQVISNISISITAFLFDINFLPLCLASQSDSTMIRVNFYKFFFFVDWSENDSKISDASCVIRTFPSIFFFSLTIGWRKIYVNIPFFIEKDFKARGSRKKLPGTNFILLIPLFGILKYRTCGRFFYRKHEATDHNFHEMIKNFLN